MLYANAAPRVSNLSRTGMPGDPDLPGPFIVSNGHIPPTDEKTTGQQSGLQQGASRGYARHARADSKYASTCPQQITLMGFSSQQR